MLQHVENGGCCEDEITMMTLRYDVVFCEMLLSFPRCILFSFFIVQRQLYFTHHCVILFDFCLDNVHLCN